MEIKIERYSEYQITDKDLKLVVKTETTTVESDRLTKGEVLRLLGDLVFDLSRTPD